MPMVEFGVCPTLEVAASAWIVPSRLEDAGSGRKFLETTVGEAKSCSFEDRESSIFSFFLLDLQFLGGFRVFQLDIGSSRQGAAAPTSGRTAFFPTAQVGSVNHHN